MLTGESEPTTQDGGRVGVLPPSLSEDGFLGGRLKILQPEKGYRAGIDAVFLAASVPVESGQSIFEAGLGVGVVSLCIAARVPSVHITGVELASRYALLAEENIKRNSLSANVRVITGDVKEATRRDLTHWPPTNSFNHVYANPPFFDDDKISQSPVSLRSNALSFGPQDLETWVKVMMTMAVPRGTITMVHRADSLARILAAFTASRIGAISVAPLHARNGDPASRVIVQGIKASRGPLQVLHGLVLHNENNSFTAEAEAILRDGKPFSLR